MKISKKTMEALFEKMSEDFTDTCPRCGGKLHPVNPFPFGGGVALSRLASVSVCGECGMTEAMNDYSHREEIRDGDFEKYVSGQLGEWYIFKHLLGNMDERRYREIFIECMESNVYDGTNVDGEETLVFLEQGEGMIIKTCHKEKPDWYECVHYDKEGYQEGVSYEHIGEDK